MFETLFRERRRSRSVRALGLLDTPADPLFDRFVANAATAFDAPVALLSLIHDDRMWFKAARGTDLTTLPRRMGFCTHALDRDDVLESCDPLADDRFRSLPVVTGAPFMRYYMGAPLRLADGMDVGVLCVLDTRTRRPASEDQRAYFRGLARQAAVALECQGDGLLEGAP